MKSFGVVDAFEKQIAEFSGSKYCVAMNTGTSAIFLSLMCLKAQGVVWCPAKTFVSVPMAIVHAGCKPEFYDLNWSGVYQLKPLPIIDGALRFRKGMYQGGLHCLSFQARKILNIGEGGAVLTDDENQAEWLRRARYSGRGSPTYKVEDIEMIGWQAYMTPEKAARGLHLMEYIEDEPDQEVDYPDLRKVKAFHEV